MFEAVAVDRKDLSLKIHHYDEFLASRSAAGHTFRIWEVPEARIEEMWCSCGWSAKGPLSFGVLAAVDPRPKGFVSGLIDKHLYEAKREAA